MVRTVLRDGTVLYVDSCETEKMNAGLASSPACEQVLSHPFIVLLLNQFRVYTEPMYKLVNKY